MTPEESVIATAVQAWTINIDRASKAFTARGDDQLQAEVGPGKNRLINLWGHLIAVHDAMLPLLGIGPRTHPELDAAFLQGADRSVAELPSAAQLREMWDEVNGRLLFAFRQFTADDWSAKHTAVSDADFGVNPLRNRLAVLLSRTEHVAYHLGQVALAPR